MPGPYPPEAESFFQEGCSIIEKDRDEGYASGEFSSVKALEGYILLGKAHELGHTKAIDHAIRYFSEGCFPVFSEKTTLEIVLLLAEYGFDEGMFLSGHFLEFGTDGEPPSDPGRSTEYYLKALDKGYESATVSLARRYLLEGSYGKAWELYDLAVVKDYRERREAVLSMGFMRYYGLYGDSPSKEDADTLWRPMGEATFSYATEYCRDHPENPSLMDFLRKCMVSFEIGFI